MLGRGPMQSKFGRCEPQILHSILTTIFPVGWTLSYPTRPSVMFYPIFRERSASKHAVARVRDGNSVTSSRASKLLGLPNELLVLVWSYMSRHDIESLSLVNRHLHHLGIQFLQEHRRLKQRYLRVENALPYEHRLDSWRGRSIQSLSKFRGFI